MGRRSPLSVRRGFPAEGQVYAHWLNGMSREEMARRYGVTTEAIRNYLRHRMSRWRKNPPALLKAGPGKIVKTVEVFTELTFREMQISLPRISMHVKAMESRV